MTSPATARLAAIALLLGGLAACRSDGSGTVTVKAHLKGIPEHQYAYLDVIELDAAVHTEYANHLKQGNPIPINYTPFITQGLQLVLTLLST